ncbi:type III pantothenate kinase [Massilia sp. Root351]|uniref:type III pantothenate kinase n=1 Tax=Massilia sp. Root351 TaxID=1736522 RepID=UPI00070D4CFF|nr:type III pantothenate kinase [Massilia sp. Root351]KQV88556.1 type III pantothenate kinase [Massilia sp. Root351]
MILLIDAGNTRIKWALAEPDAAPGTWLDYGAVMHADAAQLPAAWLAAHAALVAAGHAPATGVLAANVAGAALRDRLTHMLTTGADAVSAPDAAPSALSGAAAAPGLAGAAQPPAGALLSTPDAIEWFASVAERAGVKNGYRNPAQLGCDRFAAAIGAHALAPGQAVIVANCGTATTIDAVTADGIFLGGMILPGLGLMATSLARNTAQLPQIAQGGKLPSGFADNTDDAILSGLLAAQAGAIEHACALHQAEACLISGGAAAYIAPALPAQIPHRLVDNIVLIGLQAAAGSARP